MRTSYPTPSFSDQYKFQLVDSTFIHAVHLAKSKGSWTYSLGVSLQSDQDTIYWYIVKDPVGIYNRLTDPKKSPGFTYNNSVKGKQYTKQQVVDKTPFRQCNVKNGASTYPDGLVKDSGYPGPYITPKPLSGYVNDPKDPFMVKPLLDKEDLTATEAYWKMVADKEKKAAATTYWEKFAKEISEEAAKWNQSDRKVTKVDLGKKDDKECAKAIQNCLPVPPKPKVVQFESGYGPLLDTCDKVGYSSCIAFLGLGYNRAGKGLVIYYALKSKATDVIAVETDDASLYREWTQSSSLGKYYNQNIKGMTSVKLRSRV